VLDASPRSPPMRISNIWGRFLTLDASSWGALYSLHTAHLIHRVLPSIARITSGRQHTTTFCGWLSLSQPSHQINSVLLLAKGPIVHTHTHTPLNMTLITSSPCTCQQ
jgi:hypothetical protein